MLAMLADDAEILQASLAHDASQAVMLQPMTDAWSTWWQRARAHKKQARISDADLAAEVGTVGRAQVNHWLNGRYEPTLSQFFALCKKLEADPREILFGDHHRVAEPAAAYETSTDRRKILDIYNALDERAKRDLISLGESLLAAHKSK